MPERHTQLNDPPVADHVHVSEFEVNDLIEKSKRQYEEYMRLADLADLSDPVRPSQPRYGWDNPIGLVVADASNAELV